MFLSVFIGVNDQFFLFLCTTTGSSGKTQVYQTPSQIYRKPGQEAKIYCSHSESNYDQILWYKQSEGQMLLLGYVYFRDPSAEAGLGVKLGGGASKDQNCTLTVEDVNSSSSAVYFCAASSNLMVFGSPYTGGCN
uniref:Ig-like domain-containing protein n=1 Tax=Oryzias sinensis TaxID=183150 RepID=A0A8C7WWJ9_9TELE